MKIGYPLILSRSKTWLRIVGITSVAFMILYIGAPKEFGVYASIFGLIGMLGMMVTLFLAAVISIMDAVQAALAWRSIGMLNVLGLCLFQLLFSAGTGFMAICIARTLLGTK